MSRKADDAEHGDVLVLQTGCALLSARGRLSEQYPKTIIYVDSLTRTHFPIDMSSGQTLSQLESGPDSIELAEISGDAQPSQPLPSQTPPSPWTNPEILSGFPQTAQFLAADPDKSAVIFRRFDKVSIRNLLHLEGRVAALESIQKNLDREDNDQYWENDHIAAAAQSWEDFAVLGTEMGLRSDSMKIPYGAYEMWNQTREKRLAVQRSIAQSSAKKQSNQSESAITPDSTKPLSGIAETSELIQLRWDVALAINCAVKEYRNSLIAIEIAWRLISSRRSLTAVQPIAEP